VFEPSPGHHQGGGGIITDERLVGYILVERNGNFARYRHILGHGDHLDDGIIYQLHFAVAHWILKGDRSLRYLLYAGWTEMDEADSRPGLTQWKKKTLFQPCRIMEELTLDRESLLNELRERAADRPFPVKVLENVRSACAFYSVGLMGMRDVIHLQGKCVPEVTLVDIDGEKMAEMRKIYPQNWDYVVGDADEVLSLFRRQKRRFDVIVLDPWVTDQIRIMERLSDLLDIANQYVVISLSKNSFYSPLGVNPLAKDVLAYLKAKDERVANVSQVKCTNFDGGIFWVAIRRSPPAAELPNRGTVSRIVYHKQPFVDYVRMIRSIATDMQLCRDYQSRPKCFVIRHDEDWDIKYSLGLARAEADFGIVSSYYLNHSCAFFDYSEALAAACCEIQGLGHEIGLHQNALEVYLETGELFETILARPLAFLRDHGIAVTGTSSHGSIACQARGVANFEIWQEFERSEIANLKASRLLGGDLGAPRIPLAGVGLTYDASLMPMAAYISDSSGRLWGFYRNTGRHDRIYDLVEFSEILRSPTVIKNNIEEIVDYFNACTDEGVLQLLLHPKWWSLE
jgi:hypothetical protein